MTEGTEPMRYAYVVIAYDKVLRVFSSLVKARACLDNFWDEYCPKSAAEYDKDYLKIRHHQSGEWIAYISTQIVY